MLLFLLLSIVRINVENTFFHRLINDLERLLYIFSNVFLRFCKTFSKHFVEVNNGLSKRFG